MWLYVIDFLYTYILHWRFQYLLYFSNILVRLRVKFVSFFEWVIFVRTVRWDFCGSRLGRARCCGAGAKLFAASSAALSERWDGSPAHVTHSQSSHVDTKTTQSAQNFVRAFDRFITTQQCLILTTPNFSLLIV